MNGINQFIKMGNTAGNRISALVVISLVSLLVFTSFKGIKHQTDSDPLSGWDKDVLKKANTAEAVSYLTDEEKKLIFYTNLCRLKPKLFCRTVLTDYLKNHEDNSAQVTSLKRELNLDKPCGVLVPDVELCTMAHDYAKKMGEEGKEGHIDFQKRMKPLMSRYNRVGENCDYGYNLAIDAFIALLIDSSDPVNLGHRKNLLDANFKAIGVSCQPHKTYRWNYVMEFGG
jgi:uncharacterized protein YkwD